MRHYSVTVPCTARSETVRRFHTSPILRALTLSKILCPPRETRQSPATSHVSTASPHNACLQLSLPPMWTWTRSDDVAPLCDSLLHYVQLAHQQSRKPTVLFLRLFPDATTAQLTRSARPSSAAGSGADGARGRSLSSRREVRLPAHRLPMQAFLEAEHPWGSHAGGDPDWLLDKALANLVHGVLPRLAGTPVVLILPTRMLVTQSFCERLLDVIARHGGVSPLGTPPGVNPVVGIAFELPPNQILYEEETWMKPGRGPSSDGAAGMTPEFSWARLSLLTTPWESLLRCGRYAEALAKPLRHRLTRKSLLPLHVLLPWMLHQRMLRATEVALVMDTMVPSPGYAYQRAAAEGPSSFTVGVSTSGAMPHYMEELRERDGRGFHAYMNDHLTSEAIRSSDVRAAATDAIRRNQRSRSGLSQRDTSHLDAVTDAMRAQGQQQQLQRRKVLEEEGRHSTALPHTSSKGGDDGLLTLDAPPESLKKLILSSVISDASTSEEQQKKALYEQFGRVVTTTFAVEHGEDHHNGGGQSIINDHASESTGGPSDETPSHDSVEREIQKLETLLATADRETNPRQSFAELQVAMERELAALGCHNATTDHVNVVEGDRARDAAVESDLRSWMMSDRKGEAQAPGTAPSWHYLHGYWSCLATLYQRLNGVPTAQSPPPVAVTMPTLHAAQVQDWRSAFERHTTPSTSGRASDADVAYTKPHVVPILPPVLSPTDTDLQRAMREGKRRDTSTSTKGDATRWLPTAVECEMDNALAELPMTFRKRERLHTAHEYRRTAGESLGDGADNPLDKGGMSAAAATTIVFSEGGEDASSGHEVVIRRRLPARRPMWYASPSVVEAERRARVSRLAKEETHAGGSGERSRTTDVASHIQEVSRRFKEDVMLNALSGFVESVCENGREPCTRTLGMSVPSPGCGSVDMQRSWQQIFSK